MGHKLTAADPPSSRYGPHTKERLSLFAMDQHSKALQQALPPTAASLAYSKTARNETLQLKVLTMLYR